jgi:ribonuclease Z
MDVILLGAGSPIPNPLRASVRTLMMTHYVPNLMPGQEDEWRAIARPHFDGEIVLGDDLTSVSVAAKAS